MIEVAKQPNSRVTLVWSGTKRRSRDKCKERVISVTYRFCGESEANEAAVNRAYDFLFEETLRVWQKNGELDYEDEIKNEHERVSL